MNTAYKYVVIENVITIVVCAVTVIGLAALTEGSWGWGFLVLLNLNSFSIGEEEL